MTNHIAALLLSSTFLFLMPVSQINEMWLLIGQSNMAGHNSIQSELLTEELPHPSKKEIEHDTGNAIDLIMPSQANKKGDISSAGTFADARLKSGANNVLLLNYSVGNTGFSDNRWNPNNDLYTKAVNATNKALVDYSHYDFKGIIWQQGEKDINYSAQEYLDKVTTMINQLRSDIDQPDTPVIIGTMSEEWITSDPRIMNIDYAHRQICNYITNCLLADFKDLEADPNEIYHFTDKSFRTMGIRYSQVYEQF